MVNKMPFTCLSIIIKISWHGYMCIELCLILRRRCHIICIFADAYSCQILPMSSYIYIYSLESEIIADTLYNSYVVGVFNEL